MLRRGKQGKLTVIKVYGFRSDEHREIISYYVLGNYAGVEINPHELLSFGLSIHVLSGKKQYGFGVHPFVKFPSYCKRKRGQVYSWPLLMSLDCLLTLPYYTRKVKSGLDNHIIAAWPQADERRAVQPEAS